jgi:phosphoribosylformylglycinamidine cyclo-ligase
VPAEFAAVQRLGRVDEDEMFLTFNMGVGMILVVPPGRVDEALARLAAAGETAWVIGELAAGERGVSIE